MEFRTLKLEAYRSLNKNIIFNNENQKIDITQLFDAYDFINILYVEYEHENINMIMKRQNYFYYKNFSSNGEHFYINNKFKNCNFILLSLGDSYFICNYNNDKSIAFDEIIIDYLRDKTPCFVLTKNVNKIEYLNSYFKIIKIGILDLYYIDYNNGLLTKAAVKTRT
ncbi:hypothetical protein Hokovirus_2_23 [Hokovirus HKV1]|uniref:Uncharacterized protein n=1 Tax=Hokovirus HKV1 TaxID=1977638 RepID=A0A1V0SFI9_9VIRU|nr:hypothetical protein Hokovirus_2_23 [Hokovirus HKV1]